MPRSWTVSDLSNRPETGRLVEQVVAERGRLDMLAHVCGFVRVCRAE